MLNSIEEAALKDMICEADHAVFEDEDIADLVLDIFEQKNDKEDIENE